MPSNDIPVESVSGRDGWESVDPPDRAPERDRSRRSGRSAAASPGTRRERIRELRREVAALEAELERKDRRLQSVVERYERLYADLLERSRAERDARPDARRPGRFRRARRRLRELLLVPIERRIPDRF